jgi:hypothetical protein
MHEHTPIHEEAGVMRKRTWTRLVPIVAAVALAGAAGAAVAAVGR